VKIATKRWVSQDRIQMLLIQFLNDMGMSFDPKAPSHLKALQTALRTYMETK
jgi:hypothetical protein